MNIRKKIIFFSLFGFMLLVPVLSQASSSTDVLLLGDSHSAGDLKGVTGCFGSELYKKITQYRSQDTSSALTVQMAAACGSASHHWLKSQVSSKCGLRDCKSGKCAYTPYPQEGVTEGLGVQLKSAQPRLSIVELGTNMIGGSWSGKSGIEASVTSMIDQITQTQSRCIWIGPPQPSDKFLNKKKMTYANYLEFVEHLKAVVTKNNKCQFMDSSPYTDRNKIPQSDPLGVHYSCTEGKEWANHLFEKQLKGSLDAMLVSPNELKETSP